MVYNSYTVLYKITQKLSYLTCLLKIFPLTVDCSFKEVSSVDCLQIYSLINDWKKKEDNGKFVKKRYRDKSLTGYWTFVVLSISFLEFSLTFVREVRINPIVWKGQDSHKTKL